MLATWQGSAAVNLAGLRLRSALGASTTRWLSGAEAKTHRSSLSYIPVRPSTAGLSPYGDVRERLRSVLGEVHRQIT
ncbi:MAG: hypothetical protein AAFN40_20240 [Cyanobacteria bacterium J06560_6]